jgi:3-phenylpropionate/cinnamic acid dioxygenase small subunit
VTAASPEEAIPEQAPPGLNLRWLADELEIRNLIARLAHIADMDPLERYADCYTADVVWDIVASPSGAVNSRRGLSDVVEGSRQRRDAGAQGPGTHVRHVVSTTEIQLNGIDRAAGRSYWRMYQNADAQPEIRAMGVYDDEFVRTAEGWRLSRRVISPG